MREASAALLLVAGCAGGAVSREDVDGLRGELRALRQENEELARRVDALSGQVDVLAARARGPAPRPAAAPVPLRAPPEPRPVEPEPSGFVAAAPVVPPDLEVVKLAPPRAAGARAARTARTAPPVPTAVRIAEPEAERLEALARPSGRAISVEADRELRAAQRKGGLDRAHALEDFTGRYPRHPAADNALLESAEAYAAAGRDEAACALVRRTADEYPAGDAMSVALERLAACASRRGVAAEERGLLQRLVSDYPGTPAAERAGRRLGQLSARAGDAPPPAAPTRSGP